MRNPFKKKRPEPKVTVPRTAQQQCGCSECTEGGPEGYVMLHVTAHAWELRSLPDGAWPRSTLTNVIACRKCNVVWGHPDANKQCSGLWPAERARAKRCVCGARSAPPLDHKMPCPVFPQEKRVCICKDKTLPTGVHWPGCAMYDAKPWMEFCAGKLDPDKADPKPKRRARKARKS